MSKLLETIQQRIRLGLLTEMGKKERMYHSVFYKHEGKWRHHFDADNAEDARDEHRSLRDNGETAVTLRVPRGDAHWHRKSAEELHDYVQKRLNAKLNNKFAESLEESRLPIPKKGTRKQRSSDHFVRWVAGDTPPHSYGKKPSKAKLKREGIRESEHPLQYGWWDHHRYASIDDKKPGGKEAQKARNALVKLHHQGGAITNKGLSPAAKALAKVIRAHYNQGRGRNVVDDDLPPRHLRVPGHDVDEAVFFEELSQWKTQIHHAYGTEVSHEDCHEVDAKDKEKKQRVTVAKSKGGLVLGVYHHKEKQGYVYLPKKHFESIEIEESRTYKSGDKVKLHPDYAEPGKRDEIFTVGHSDSTGRKVWIGDKQNRGWYAGHSQLIPARSGRGVVAPKRIREAEDLTELSKKTLGRYVTRAAHDYAMVGYRAGEHDATIKTLDKNRNKLIQKARARTDGIHLATKRLVKEENVDEALTGGMPRKITRLPTKRFGPQARRPVISTAVKILRRPRTLKDPTTLRDRQMLDKDRAMRRARMGGKMNSDPSRTVARWKHPTNVWQQKGKV